jgi:hypothetical protein
LTRITFGSKGGRVKSTVTRGDRSVPTKSVEDVVREMKMSNKGNEDYRERSLAIHGLICARCAREFDHSNRHLLTVHHKDGNHDNNPPDGSNWENLCAYCHEDVHSRELLGDYFKKGSRREESALVYSEKKEEGTLGSMAAKLQEALKRKK